MKTLFIADPGIFDNHLDGATIPMCLMMVSKARAGETIVVQLGPRRVRVDFDRAAETLDATHASARLSPAEYETYFDLVVYQKGVPDALPDGVNVDSRALMLNDARGRQAMNQFHELLTGRFGFDAYRMSAPLRALQGTHRDRAQLQRFDTVFVQTAPEADYLKRRFPTLAGKVAIFCNAAVTLRLFPEQVVAQPDTPRRRRFLLPVPPGLRRFGEYKWFLDRLASCPELLAQTAVLAPEAFRPLLPDGVVADSSVADFHGYLTGFDCVLVPTGHYTGLNNRVFSAAVAGCRLLASPEALEGLIPGAPEIVSAPRSFADFRRMMERWPEGALSPDVILNAVKSLGA